MKKLFVVLTVIALVGFMSSCTPSAEKLLVQYEKAVEKADLEKATKVALEIEELGEEAFSEEQQERLLEAATAHALLEMGKALQEKQE